MLLVAHFVEMTDAFHRNQHKISLSASVTVTEDIYKMKMYSPIILKYL